MNAFCYENMTTFVVWQFEKRASSNTTSFKVYSSRLDRNRKIQTAANNTSYRRHPHDQLFFLALFVLREIAIRSLACRCRPNGTSMIKK